MTTTVSVPLWLALLVALLAAWAAVDRLLLPGTRWVLRRRVHRVLEEVGARLSIRIRPFQLTKRQVLLDQLAWDADVQAAAEAASRAEGVPREVAMARVAAYAKEIVPAFNAWIYFRFGYALARGAARFLYRVRLASADQEALAAIPEDASVVFVMNHRSNMDYVLVGYLAAERTALSYAVGEWARVWPLQALFRSMGAYFVRRDSKDALYRKVLERYVAMATAAGVPQAVYPEGGLTRDGRLRPPRLGILDYMLRGAEGANGRDLVFVPVGINYDRTLEDRTLLLDGAPGTPRPGAGRALWNTIAFVAKNLGLMVRNEWHRFGYACVSFGKPVSLRDWTRARGVALAGLPKDERFLHVGALATDLMREIGACIPVLPVPLVAAALLAAGRPLSALELKGEVLGLSRALASRGARVYVPRADQDYAVDVGLRMLVLRHAVAERGGLFEEAPGGRALLDYYAGSIAHLLPG